MRRFALPAKYPHDVTFLIELHDRVGPLVDRPDIVVLVDPHGVSVRPGIQTLADFAEELAARIELEPLCSCSRI